MSSLKKFTIEIDHDLADKLTKAASEHGLSPESPISFTMRDFRQPSRIPAYGAEPPISIAWQRLLLSTPDSRRPQHNSSLSPGRR